MRHSARDLLTASAAGDRNGKHTLSRDPATADLILFAEMGAAGWLAERVRDHALYKQYPEKCYVFDSGDHCVPVLPGLYASLTRRYADPGYARTGYYLNPENPYIEHRPLLPDAPYLAAFIGSSHTHPVRKALFRFDRPDILVRDTTDSSYRMQYHGEGDEKEFFWQFYAQGMADAAFSLCPRGLGPGTIRLFESMRMGRACVILADDWPRIEGVDWDAFSLFVPEADVERLPEILLAHRARAAEMGERARQQWETFASPAMRFHWVTEQCLAIGSHSRRHHRRRLLRMLHPENTRRMLQGKAMLYRWHKKIFL